MVSGGHKGSSADRCISDGCWYLEDDSVKDANEGSGDLISRYYCKIVVQFEKFIESYQWLKQKQHVLFKKKHVRSSPLPSCCFLQWMVVMSGRKRSAGS
ncbi:hypothetical protein RYX36_011175 [Vicia faba]